MIKDINKDGILIMKKTLYSAILGLSLLFLAGGFSNVNAQELSGSIGKGAVSRGATVRAFVVLNIPGNLHVNANRPGNEYSIPTTVKLRGSGVKIGGVSYPRGKRRSFSFSDESIFVYEGRTVLGFNVTVPKGYRGNTIKINATVRTQACTNEVCYPPKNQNVTLTAKVR